MNTVKHSEETGAREIPEGFEDTSSYPVTPAGPGHDPGPPGKRQRPPVLRLLLFAALAITGVGVLVRESETAVSLQGSVEGNLIHVRAAAPGVASRILASEGDAAGTAQVLAEIDAAGLPARLRRLEELKALKQAESAQVEKSIARENEHLRLLHEISRRLVKEIELEIEDADLACTLARDRVHALKPGLAKGWVAGLDYAEADTTWQRAAKQLEEKRNALQLQTLIAESAAKGQYYHNGEIRTVRDDLEAKAARLKTEMGELELEGERLQAEFEATRIRSRRGGSVFAVHQHEGASVNPGDVLMTLETDDQRCVVASFKFSEARKIAPGDTATIEIGALNTTVEGTVRGLGHEALGLTDVHSPFLRITPDEVMAKIELHEHPEGLKTGMRANVRVKTSGRGSVASFVNALRPRRGDDRESRGPEIDFAHQLLETGAGQ